MPSDHKQDSAFSNLLSNVLQADTLMAEAAPSAESDQHERLLALQRYFCAPAAFEPGQIVQWKSGMRNRRLPRDGEPAIVVEVLDTPVLNTGADLEGSNLYREPLSLVLGVLHDEGMFFLYHYDGRRFEVIREAGEQP